MPNLFIIIGSGSSSWRTGQDELTLEYIELAPRSYQICVGTNSGNVYLGPYWEWYIKGWYQGSWFIRNPIKKMLRSDFKKLVKKINKTISQKYPKDRDYGPLFMGETYSEMYPQLVKCMDEIIELFKSETGNNNWSYDEGVGESIKSKLKRGDKFVENWNQRLAALKSYTLSRASHLSPRLPSSPRSSNPPLAPQTTAE